VVNLHASRSFFRLSLRFSVVFQLCFPLSPTSGPPPRPEEEFVRGSCLFFRRVSGCSASPLLLSPLTFFSQNGAQSRRPRNVPGVPAQGNLTPRVIFYLLRDLLQSAAAFFRVALYPCTLLICRILCVSAPPPRFRGL